MFTPWLLSDYLRPVHAGMKLLMIFKFQCETGYFMLYLYSKA